MESFTSAKFDYVVGKVKLNKKNKTNKNITGVEQHQLLL